MKGAMKITIALWEGSTRRQAMITCTKDCLNCIQAGGWSNRYPRMFISRCAALINY